MDSPLSQAVPQSKLVLSVGYRAPTLQQTRRMRSVPAILLLNTSTALASTELQPFAYCFRDTNRHQIDLVVAEMLGIDPAGTAVREMLEHYRLLFSSEPNVNGRQKSIVKALEQYQEAPNVTQTTLL